jgi:hypothetical protein
VSTPAVAGARRGAPPRPPHKPRWQSLPAKRNKALALAVLALAGTLTGCETTAEKSERLAKAAKHARPAERGLSISRPSAYVHVTSALLVRGTAGAAAIVTLRNTSSRALENVPLAITVKDARGGTVFQNNAPGLETALTSLASLPAHGEITWVNDQIPASGDPASVSVLAGEAPAASASLPQLEVSDVHASEESPGSAGAAGSVRNRSHVAQSNLVVYVLARRGARVVAASRALLPEAAPGATVSFQAFLVGEPRGAKLQASAPPTTLG